MRPRPTCQAQQPIVCPHGPRIQQLRHLPIKVDLITGLDDMHLPGSIFPAALEVGKASGNRYFHVRTPMTEWSSSLSGAAFMDSSDMRGNGIRPRPARSASSMATARSIVCMTESYS